MSEATRYMPYIPPEYDYEQKIELQERANREALEEKAKQAIEKLYWYDQQIVKLYIELGNYRAIEAKTGIPYSSAYKTVQRAIKEIREKIGLPPLDEQKQATEATTGLTGNPQ